jgi:clan AA aspartic protease
VIIGRVNEEVEGEIDLKVMGAKVSEEIIATIDTGFNGFMTLPGDVIALLELEWLNEAPLTLADGQEYSANAYSADLEWDGSRRRIVIDEAEVKPLIGTSLLRGYKLEMEFKPDGELRLESLVK